MYQLCTPHSFFVILFVWCTVVYAHGRTYIDVSFSCLYGVPLVYARGRTHIDRALAWLGGVPVMFSYHSLVYAILLFFTLPSDRLVPLSLRSTHTFLFLTYQLPYVLSSLDIIALSCWLHVVTFPRIFWPPAALL